MSSPSPLTLLERKILRFFHEHPEAVESVRGIATWLGLDLQAAGQALEALVSRKWLAIHATGALTGYALTPDERLLTQIRQALEESIPS